MKLGNQGFGLREMIIYTCILLILLIFVSIQIDSLYKKTSRANANNEKTPTQLVEDTNKEDKTPVNSVDYDYYKSLESKIQSATVLYLNANHYELSGNIMKVSTDTLRDLGYLNTPLIAQDGYSKCSGYSNVYENANKEIVVNSYITCNNYTTAGYSGV